VIRNSAQTKKARNASPYSRAGVTDRTHTVTILVHPEIEDDEQRVVIGSEPAWEPRRPNH
jgi:hypothetical protein